MVSKLKYYASDPNREERGAGYYYHRGFGVYSKYGRERDMERSAKTNLSTKQAGRKYGGRPGAMAHMGDSHVGNYRKKNYW